MLREIFTRDLMCCARDRHIVVCESLVEPTKSREALLQVLFVCPSSILKCTRRAHSCCEHGHCAPAFHRITHAFWRSIGAGTGWLATWLGVG